MQFILLVSIFVFSFGFRNKIKSFHQSRLFSLKEPNDKPFHKMDLFEKFEKFSMENNEEKEREYLFRIYKFLQQSQKKEIIDLDFAKLVQQMDQVAIENIHKGNIPRPPETEDEIEEDSFEGYLRSEFNKICKNNTIEFETYYKWRKEKGIVFTKEEILDFYNIIVSNKERCSLMEFITLNKIIDENNAAEY